MRSLKKLLKYIGDTNTVIILGWICLISVGYHAIFGNIPMGHGISSEADLHRLWDVSFKLLILGYVFQIDKAVLALSTLSKKED